MVTDPLTVAIDGPAGSGKSTVAARLAARFGLAHVDTGAMYRALTLIARREGIGPDDGTALAARLETLELAWRGGELTVAGERVQSLLRTPEIDAQVSAVSAHREVRRMMQRRQREVAWSCPEGAVMEGRDIGSAVLPLSPCKIYLDANPSERARRRSLQAGLGEDPEVLTRTQSELERRDALDAGRAESPLQIAPDAHVVDTTDLDIDEVVARCAELVEAGAGQPLSDEEFARLRFQHARYRVAWNAVRWVASRVYGLRILGSDHERCREGLIYASNHISWLDPPLVGCGALRELYYLAKRELFVGPLGWLISAFNAVPIVRGRYDAKAFDVSRELLASGRSLLIFPEGTRKPVGRPGPMKKGLGILAMETGAPYVPCYIRGSRGLIGALLRRHRLELWIGPPTRLHALVHLRRTLSESEIQTRVGELFLAQVRAFAHRAELSDREAGS